MRVLQIAKNTFRETIRDRILRVIIGLCFIVFLISKGIAEISMGQDIKIIADFSLWGIDVFGMTLCIFIGASLIYKEVDKRTLYTVVACPLSRWEFILGKYLGMNATLALSVLLMGIVFYIFFWICGGVFHWKMVGAIFLLFLGLTMLNAIAIFFSTMASPTLSAVFTVAIFLTGRASYELKYLSERYIGIKRDIFMWLYYLLPNFNNFNIKLIAVHDLPIDHPIASFCGAIGYTLLYSAFMLYLASIIFKKKNL